MTDRQSTHAADCWGWGPKHYECAVREIERLAARLGAETSNARGDVEYEYEVWQDGVLHAGGREADYASAQSEARHYAAMYTPDGPVEVRIYEKRMLSTTQQPAVAQPQRRRYDPSGSLSEYGIFPECDAQPLEAPSETVNVVGMPEYGVSPERDAQRPAGDGCHCATCTCNPNMTPAVRFDLSPAQQEGAIREHLIRLGWTPPDELRPVLALIRAQGDLGLQEWREVVYYDDEAEEWRSYAGSDTFEDGEQVVRWVYAEAVLP